MRTLTLTHEQISIITNALGIAEQRYAIQYQELVSLITVRGNNGKSSEGKHASLLYKKSCEFADLNQDIMNSKFDV